MGDGFIYVMDSSLASVGLAVKVKVNLQLNGYRMISTTFDVAQSIKLIKVGWRREVERWGGRSFIYGLASRVLAVKVKVNWASCDTCYVVLCS